MARWPAVGAVKTRLSPALPAPLARDLHAALLADAFEVAASSGAEERLLYWADAPADRGVVEVPPGVAVRDQAGQDLGARLARVFAELLAAPGDRVVAIGTDCPDLTPGILREAYEALDSCDLVLGPASDGGYYLIALRRPAPELFFGVAWGTPQVLEQTLERAKAVGLEAALLGGLSDLDTPDDLVRFIARRTSTPGPTSPHTERALRAMGLLPPPA